LQLVAAAGTESIQPPTGDWNSLRPGVHDQTLQVGMASVTRPIGSQLVNNIQITFNIGRRGANDPVISHFMTKSIEGTAPIILS
jgi:hypothetical protein